MKAILHAFLNWKNDILKVTKQNIFFQNYFSTNDLQRNSDIEIQKIHSCENLIDLFTKSLSRWTFEQLIHNIELRHLNDVSLHEEINRICDE